jgi:glutaconate CoA-transferase subunit B
MGYRGLGPDALITELGVFDFDDFGHARLASVYPDTDVAEVRENTDFEFPIRQDVATVTLPSPAMVEFIRNMDPLRIHERELKPQESARCFSLS